MNPFNHSQAKLQMGAAYKTWAFIDRAMLLKLLLSSALVLGGKCRG